MNRRDFLTAAAVTSALGLRTLRAADDGTTGTAPAVGRSSRVVSWAEVPVRRVEVASTSQFRCVQVTDLHQFHTTAEDDQHTFGDIQKYAERWKPDLIIATGDLWHDNDHGEGPRGVDRLVREIPKLGIPWTMIWGNHDRLDDYQAGHDAFAGADHSVYGGATSHGDYRLEIVGRDGRTPLLDLFCLNSNHEGLGPWQLTALKTMLAQVQQRNPAGAKGLLFHHIPMEDIKTRLTAETFQGLKLEEVASLADHGHTFPVVQASGVIRACFCGHNHVNDYSLKLSGVSLNYGRSTGHAGYGGDRLRKGAKLIEVDLASGEVRSATIFPDGSRLA